MSGPTGSFTSPVLVGRAEELSQVFAACTTPPAVVQIEGEAGVGKSRLIREALSAAC